MFDPSLLALIYQLFKDFGVGLCEFGIIVWLLWKIATNHLHHIGTDVKAVSDKVDTLSADVKASTKNLNEKIDAIDSKANTLDVKVAKLEGQVQK